MSEWIDFSVYAAQLIVCLSFASRWAAQFKDAVVVDRNPEWSAANPQVVANLVRRNAWSQAIQAWTALGVLALLVCRLDLQPVALESPGVPGWRTLMATAYLFLGVGFLLFGAGAVMFTRRLKRSVPLGEQRRASLTPRSLDAFVPRGLKFAVYGVLLAAIAARPVAGLFFPARIADVGNGFIFSLLTGCMLFLAVAISVRRRPNVFDRVLGSGYRKREVRACLTLMAFHALGLLALVWLEVAGLDVRRYSGVIFSAVVTVVLASLMPFPPREDPDAAATLRVAPRS
jgi:hypothetical protein